eukprot:2526079-Pleurochrysis_carterae.AAC.8
MMRTRLVRAEATAQQHRCERGHGVRVRAAKGRALTTPRTKRAIGLARADTRKGILRLQDGAVRLSLAALADGGGGGGRDEAGRGDARCRHDRVVAAAVARTEAHPAKRRGALVRVASVGRDGACTGAARRSHDAACLRRGGVSALSRCV